MLELRFGGDLYFHISPSFQSPPLLSLSPSSPRDAAVTSSPFRTSPPLPCRSAGFDLHCGRLLPRLHLLAFSVQPVAVLPVPVPPRADAVCTRAVTPPCPCCSQPADAVTTVLPLAVRPWQRGGFKLMTVKVK